MASHADEMRAGFGLASVAAMVLGLGAVAAVFGAMPLAVLLLMASVAAGTMAAVRFRRRALRRVRRRAGVRAASEPRWMPRRSRRGIPGRNPFKLKRNPATGRVEGRVIRGRYAGRPIESVPLDALLGLAAEMDTGDPRLMALLEEFLDHAHPRWDSAERDASSRQREVDPDQMTEAEAYRLLGLAPGATLREIADAHRRLILKVHPDAGGSDVLAAQVNAAKAKLSRLHPS